MQKKLIALAVAGLVSGGAFAQSNVTLYGTIDAGIRNVDNVNAAGDSQLTMNSVGTYNSNRWGVKGSEDLGGGMKANFNLEGGFNNATGAMDDGATLFRRKAIVGLQGGWGKLDMGRNYTAMFYTVAGYDPFNYKYTAIIPTAGLDKARRNSDIQYTGSLGSGLTVRAEHALGEVAGSNSNGATTELAMSYGNGPMGAGIGFGTEKSATGVKTDSWTIGGSYTMGAMRLAVGYFDKKADVATGGENETKNAWLGGSFAMGGANTLSAAYYDTKFDNVGTATDGAKKLFIVGFVHNLSKRTEFYADIDSTKLEGKQKIGTQDRQTGLSVGVNHAF